MRRAIIRCMLASRSKPARLRLRGAVPWVSLAVVAACSSPNDFFDRPMGAGGSKAGNGGTFAQSGSGGTSAIGGSAGASGGSGPAAGNGGIAGSANAGGAGAAAGTETGSGGFAGQAGEGGESGEPGRAGSGGASGSGGEGVAGTQGEAGVGGGTAGDGGSSAGVAGSSGGVAGGAGNAGVGGIGGIGGAVGGDGGGGKGGGGKGGCGAQPEVCDGVNNNCAGGIDEGNACPAGCEGATEEGRVYVLCAGNGDSGSWQAAEMRCEGAISKAAGVAMKLALIETAKENEFLSEWVQDRNPSDGAWMGANDLDVDNEWAWGTGAARVPFYLDKGEGNNGDVIMNRYNDWGNGRPNGDTAMQPDEDCGHFDPVYNWRWNDRRCGDSLPAFVCEQSP